MTQKEIRTLVLIHGWGFDSRVWKNFIPHLEDQWRVTCLDLPGYGTRGKIASADIDQIVSNIEPDVPENAVLFAWSLGGLIAMKLANRKEDVKALVLIASSPCFLNKQDWQQGIELADFNKLVKQLSEDKIQTLKTFSGLVAMGEEQPRQTINTLNEQLTNNVPEQEILMSGLEMLRDEDLRQNIEKQHCPISFIFGENDILVKRSTGSAIQTVRRDVQTIEIPDTGHAPFLSCPQETADALLKLTTNLF